MVISSRKFENFELFCPLGAMKLVVQQKKVTASNSAKPGPHINIFVMVPSIYGALMPFNFYGDRERGLGARTKLLEENFWEAKF